MDSGINPGHHFALMTLLAAVSGFGQCQGVCPVPVSEESVCSTPLGQNTRPAGGRDVCPSGGPGSENGVHRTHRFWKYCLWSCL